MVSTLPPVAAARLLRGIIAGTGAIAFLTGGCVAFGGTAAIPGGTPTTASNDSVLRFYAIWWAAQGPAALRLVHDPMVDPGAVRHLAATTFCGGLARLAAVRASGRPHPVFRVLTIVELGLPPLMIALARRAAGPHAAVAKGGYDGASVTRRGRRRLAPDGSR